MFQFISSLRRFLYAFPNFCQKKTIELANAICARLSETRLREKLGLFLLLETLIIITSIALINITGQHNGFSLVKSSLSCTIVGDMFQVIKAISYVNNFSLPHGNVFDEAYFWAELHEDAYFWLLSGLHYLGFILLYRLLTHANFKILTRVIHYIVYTLSFGATLGNALETFLLRNSYSAWQILHYHLSFDEVNAFIATWRWLSAFVTLALVFAFALLSLKLLVYSCKELYYFMVSIMILSGIIYILLPHKSFRAASFFMFYLPLNFFMGKLEEAGYSEFEYVFLGAMCLYVLYRFLFYSLITLASKFSLFPDLSNKNLSGLLTTAKCIFLYPEVAILLGMCLYYSFCYLF